MRQRTIEQTSRQGALVLLTLFSACIILAVAAAFKPGDPNLARHLPYAIAGALFGLLCVGLDLLRSERARRLAVLSAWGIIVFSSAALAGFRYGFAFSSSGVFVGAILGAALPRNQAIPAALLMPPLSLGTSWSIGIIPDAQAWFTAPIVVVLAIGSNLLIERTDRLHAQVRVIQSDQALRAQRSEMAESLLKGLDHSMRNGLAIITVNATLLEGPDPRARQHIKIIRETSNRLVKALQEIQVTIDARYNAGPLELAPNDASPRASFQQPRTLLEQRLQEPVQMDKQSQQEPLEGNVEHLAEAHT